jgi:serine/threonine-protein kinase
MEPGAVVKLVLKAASASQVAHRAGIIRRDLHPGNILINREEEPLLVGFGPAHRLDEEGTRLTQISQTIGTLGYMAPEQLSGTPEAVGLACDVFSLGNAVADTR